MKAKSDVLAWHAGDPIVRRSLSVLWDRFDLGRRSWLRGRTVRLGHLQVHSTSLISGLLFIGIGVLFLRYDGTAGITGLFGLGDTVDLEFAAQQAVSRWAATLPVWSLPALVLVVASSVAWRRIRRPAPAEAEEGPPTAEAAAGQSPSTARAMRN